MYRLGTTGDYSVDGFEGLGYVTLGLLDGEAGFTEDADSTPLCSASAAADTYADPSQQVKIHHVGCSQPVSCCLWQ